ncbi:alpha/beta hydrolase [Dehalobacter sp. DCM]|uniref:alpha/beta hydrolase n=1 Tax=Dehalobacter sp. DCM TaxID=2907827 RepID=UPI003081A9F0|nr:alpha/beta hydrolase [Dehalobacter sp. DCM]
MKRSTLRVIKMLSHLDIHIKRTYRIYRKIQKLLNPQVKTRYHLLDHRILVEHREVPVRIFRPENHETTKSLIFFHGGGWVTGNIDSYTPICTQLANQTQHNVISVDYALAPENPFPAGLEECYRVTREIFLNPLLLPCCHDDITLIGDSAGGNLAAAVSLMARDRGDFLPKRQILIYPATYNDHSSHSPFESVRTNGKDYIFTSKRIQDYMDLYIQNDEDRSNPYFSPLLAENLSQQPQTLIITAEYDPLRDEGEMYGVRLKDFGNSVMVHRISDALHGFFSFPWNKEALKECIMIINAFLNNEKTASKKEQE